MKLDFSNCTGPDHARVYPMTHAAMQTLADCEFVDACVLKCAQYLFNEMIGENEHSDFEGVEHVEEHVDAIVGCIMALSAM